LVKPAGVWDSAVGLSLKVWAKACAAADRFLCILNAQKSMSAAAQALAQTFNDKPTALSHTHSWFYRAALRWEM